MLKSFRMSRASIPAAYGAPWSHEGLGEVITDLQGLAGQVTRMVEAIEDVQVDLRGNLLTFVRCSLDDVL